MFFDPMGTLRRLLQAIPETGRRFVRPAPALPASAVVTVGCCPVCHEFVRINPVRPPAHSYCPSCGRAIRGLDPLGSERSRAGESLWDQELDG